MSSILDDTVEVPRRTMTLFFLVDTSKSMEGKKIGAVNESIQEVLPMINDISATNPDAEIKVAALLFSCGTSWVYDEPKSASDFVWQDVSAIGPTPLGEACRELNSKLSRNGFMKTASGSYAPVIILLSDGDPSDDFESGLAKLKTNNWFKAAIKIAIAIGDDVKQETLAQFTGTSESVFPVHSIDALRKMIRIVAVTSSQVGSQSSAVGDTSKQDEVNRKIAEAQQEEISSEKPSSDIGERGGTDQSSGSDDSDGSNGSNGSDGSNDSDGSNGSDGSNDSDDTEPTSEPESYPDWK
ncbi:MAG: VWA domain-containing protein [Succinivibrionaceae bacterium]|nr:VWA domain-containing protein [Succinivibrionaceae bacterium]